jgi:mannosylglycerate hydrolase
MKKNMHLMINTHWDREWRWSFRETQSKLKYAMDLLIETMGKDERFNSFHTDAQVSMVDDYLDICPENRDRVVTLIKSGKLLIGPWYTLPAEFLVSEESLVRNLLTGHRLAVELGGVMKAGYNIFSWGQVSQLPQIYKQFGMDTIIFYRGIDKSSLDTLEFWWEAPDGTKSLGITFGANIRHNFFTYVYKPYLLGDNAIGFDRTGDKGFIFNLGDSHSEHRNYDLVNQISAKNGKNAIAGMDELIESLKKAATNELLLLQGMDLENPNPEVPDLVEFLNSNIDSGKIVIDTLPEYIEAVKKALKQSGKDKELPVLKREMLDAERVGMSLGPLFIGVLSARMPIKLLNADRETRLAGWAEPSCVMDLLCGGEYPKRQIDVAWKILCQNQQHDGIGGCHVDRVTLATTERYNEVKDISETVTKLALQNISSKIDFSDIRANDTGLIVFNPLSYKRLEMVIATVDIPVENVESNFGGIPEMNSGIDIYDSNGNIMPSYVMEEIEQTIYVERTYGGRTSFPAIRFKVAFMPGEIPGFGYKIFFARHKNSVDRPTVTMITATNKMENEFLKITVNSDGTLNIKDKTTGEEFTRLNYFEDGGEVGGPLVHVAPKKDSVYSTLGQKADCMLIESTPLFATFRIQIDWKLPVGVEMEYKRQIPNPAMNIESGQFARKQEKCELKITTDVTLRKGSRTLEFRTIVHNNILNHRLRVVFPTKLDTEHVYVDTPFDVVKRDINIPDSSGWFEEAPRTFPSYSFINLSDKQKGLTLFHQGIHEYEVFENEDKSIALTLLRCFEVAGGGMETYRQEPLAQYQGNHEFRYSILLHNGSISNGELFKYSKKFRTPVRIAQVSRHNGQIKQGKTSFIEFESDNLVVTALKKAEIEDAIVIRCFNPSRSAEKASVSILRTIERAVKVTMEEKMEKEIEIHNNNSFEIRVRPGEVYSSMIYFK